MMAKFVTRYIGGPKDGGEIWHTMAPRHGDEIVAHITPGRRPVYIYDQRMQAWKFKGYKQSQSTMR